MSECRQKMAGYDLCPDVISLAVQVTALQAERDALLIIASKYCPKDHPVDWKKILEIARDK